MSYFFSFLFFTHHTLCEPHEEQSCKQLLFDPELSRCLFKRDVCLCVLLSSNSLWKKKLFRANIRCKVMQSWSWVWEQKQRGKKDAEPLRWIHEKLQVSWKRRSIGRREEEFQEVLTQLAGSSLYVFTLEATFFLLLVLFSLLHKKRDRHTSASTYTHKPTHIHTVYTVVYCPREKNIWCCMREIRWSWYVWTGRRMRQTEREDGVGFTVLQSWETREGANWWFGVCEKEKHQMQRILMPPHELR